jgi:hypothetical protein
MEWLVNVVRAICLLACVLSRVPWPKFCTTNELRILGALSIATLNAFISRHGPHNALPI